MAPTPSPFAARVRPHSLPTLACLALALALAAALPTRACYPQDQSNKNAVTIGKDTYVCLIMNDRNVTVNTVVADTYTRLVLQGSFNATTHSFGRLPACADPANRFYFPTGCPGSGEVPTTGLGSLSLNYYISSMGVNSNYKKVYGILQGTGTSTQRGRVVSYFPITTAVIEVDHGTVTSVYWDDGCYFCPWNTGSLAEEPQPSYMNCLNNAFNMQTNAITRFNKTRGDMGRDCALTTLACPANSGSLCDLGIYVVWTGTDAAGHQFASAGRRFRRYRQYNLAPQLPAMQRFGGNDVTKSTTDVGITPAPQATPENTPTVPPVPTVPTSIG